MRIRFHDAKCSTKLKLQLGKHRILVVDDFGWPPVGLQKMSWLEGEQNLQFINSMFLPHKLCLQLSEAE
jgi:hypothetical protein